MMVGRKLEDLYPEKTSAPGEVVLRVSNMSDKELVKNASFEIRSGEVLGLSGLVGAGRTELARMIFGADPKVSGEVYLNGKLVNIKHPIDAVYNGIGYVPEDRKNAGVFLQMSCRDNIAMNIFNRSATAGVINFNDVNERSKVQAKALRLRAASLWVRAGGLSGGNQQKLLLARWLEINPKVLILDEPTRGGGYRRESGDLFGDPATRQQGHGRAFHLERVARDHRRLQARHRHARRRHHG